MITMTRSELFARTGRDSSPRKRQCAACSAAPQARRMEPSPFGGPPLSPAPLPWVARGILMGAAPLSWLCIPCEDYMRCGGICNARVPVRALLGRGRDRFRARSEGRGTGPSRAHGIVGGCNTAPEGKVRTWPKRSRAGATAPPKGSPNWAVRGRATPPTTIPACLKRSRTSIRTTTTWSRSAAPNSPRCARLPASPTSPPSTSTTFPTSAWWKARASSSTCSASATTATSTKT
jgi:hypothetical protein